MLTLVTLASLSGAPHGDVAAALTSFTEAVARGDARDAQLVRRWAQPDPRAPVVLANEAFALHHSPQQRLCRRPVAAGVFAECLVSLAGGGNGGQVVDSLKCELVLNGAYPSGNVNNFGFRAVGNIHLKQPDTQCHRQLQLFYLFGK